MYSTKGASAEEIAKTMHQALEKAGASPEEMAKVLAQALAESGASRKHWNLHSSLDYVVLVQVYDNVIISMFWQTSN